jgi:uncharacterized damage-inducible protein DinB
MRANEHGKANEISMNRIGFRNSPESVREEASFWFGAYLLFSVQKNSKWALERIVSKANGSVPGTRLSLEGRGVMLLARLHAHGREEKAMKRIALVVAVLLAFGTAVVAQDAAPGPVANPVSTTVKTQLTRYEKNMVAAADMMPAEKYNFKPTPEMSSFGHVVMHIAQSNYFLCSKISGQTAPELKIADTDPKDKLVAALKGSFEFCSASLANVDDSKLSDPLTMFGGRQSSRAGALITLSDDWYDHYGAQAVYLRLNGILPPTAQPAK